MVIGTLVYNEIVIIRYFGFDLNTREAIEKRKKLNGDLEDGETPAYTGLSPQAAYDAQRNKRSIR